MHTASIYVTKTSLKLLFAKLTHNEGALKRKLENASKKWKWAKFNILIPYRAKLSWAKLFVGWNFLQQTQNSSSLPDEKFHPMKVKVSFSWGTSEPKRVTSHFYKLWLSCWARLFFTFKKIGHFRTTYFRLIAYFI